MADDIITRLIVQGERDFVNAMANAAKAQQVMLDTVARAATLPPSNLSNSISQAVLALEKAGSATNALKLASGETSSELESLRGKIANNTKALIEYADGLARVEQREAQITKQRQEFTASLPKGVQTGFVQQGGVFADVTKNFGTAPQNLPNVVQAAAQAEQRAFLESIVVQRELQDRKLASRRAFIEASRRLDEQELKRIEVAGAQQRTTQARLQSEADRIFARQNAALLQGPTRVATAPTGVLSGLTGETQRLTRASQDKNRVLNEQDTAHKKVGASGISYLSTLSALHAASFLLTNRTFSAFFSLITLGAAFTRVGLGASLLGVTFGGVLLGLNALATGIARVQQLVLLAGQAFVAFGGVVATAVSAAVVASGKLASGVEDAFSEIVAFGEPTQEQLGQIEERVSQLARRFGISAQDVAQASSQYIRAGGDIDKAIGQDAFAAVVKLQTASRQELLPQNAARAITTLTNTFTNESLSAASAADLMIATAQKSALTFTEVSQAFQQAAPQAANLNINSLDLAATMAVLANNGLRGQVAGTGFKQVLIDLLNPSKQARERLREYNISLFDTEGKVRNLGDIFADMKVAFGEQAEAIEKTGDAQRGQAIAAIFGSRANLAASIIARTGAEEYNKMRDAIANVDADKVLETLLSTTSAQIRVTTTNIQEFARAFGGPLNTAIGVTIKQMNDFLQTIGRRPFELAGQSIIAVASAQGFGSIIEGIEELSATQPRVATFFTGILNSALTVRNAFIGQFVPAVQTAANTINTAFTSSNIEGAFTGITAAILGVIDVSSRLVQFIGEIVASFVSGDERGQQLRRTLAGVATSIGVGLVGSLALAAVPMAFAVKLLESIGQATLDLMDDMHKFNTLWDAAWQLAKTSLNNFLKDVAPRLQATGQLLVSIATGSISGIQEAVDRLNKTEFGEQAADAVRNFGTLDNAMINTGAQLGRVRREMAEWQAQLDNLEDQGEAPFSVVRANINLKIQEFKRQEALLSGTLSSLQTAKLGGVEGTSTTISQLGSFQQKLLELRAQIEQARRNPVDLDRIFNFSEGELPEFLTELNRRASELEQSINRVADQEPTGPPGFFDTGTTDKADEVSKKIVDIFRDTNREVDNLIQDSFERQSDALGESLERITDALNNFNRQIAKIDKDTIRRQQEVMRDISEQRTDRAFNQTVQRIFEDMDRSHDEFNQRRDFREQQAQAVNERLNQRRLQDEEKTLSQIEQLEERAFSQSQSIRERAFQRSQQDDERRLTKRQQREEEALTKQLERESTRRDETRRLTEAKTPEDKARVQADINRAREDRRFQEGQQTQLKQLRDKHERENIAFQRTQEEQSFAFRIQQQIQEFNFRILLEKRYQEIRRGLENIEFQRTDFRDLALFNQRIERARFEAERRRTMQQGQQDALDKYEDQRLVPRRFARIEEEAQRRRDELGTSTAEAIFNLIDQAEEARNKATLQRDRQARTIEQRAEERVKTLEQEVGFVPEAAVRQLDAVILRLALEKDLWIENQTEAARLFSIIEQGATLDILQRAPGTEFFRQSRDLNLRGIVTVPENLPTTINQSLQVTLPPNFTDAITLGFAAALQAVGAFSQPQGNVIIQGNAYSTDQLWQQVQRHLYGSARR